MSGTDTGGVWSVVCAKCGVAMLSAVKPEFGQVFQHATCPQILSPPPLTEADVRRIVSSELRRLVEAKLL